MKRSIIKLQKYIAIKGVLEQYPAMFENKPAAIEIRDDFFGKITDINNCVNQLVSPHTALLVDRKNLRKEVRDQLKELINLAIAVAHQSGNNPLIETLKSYNKSINSYSSAMMVAVGQNMQSLLAENEASAIKMGLDARITKDLVQQVFDFQQVLVQTQLSLQTRRETHEQLRELFRESKSLLRDRMDGFVRYHKRSHPTFYRAYMRLRRAVPKPAVVNLPENSDISGTVTDSVTGLPIANAVINLIEHGFVMETGVDGTWLLDELIQGTYTVSCHATGYEVPPQGVFELGTNDSVVHHFVLTPVSG